MQCSKTSTGSAGNDSQRKLLTNESILDVQVKARKKLFLGLYEA